MKKAMLVMVLCGCGAVGDPVCVGDVPTCDGGELAACALCLDTDFDGFLDDCTSIDYEIACVDGVPTCQYDWLETPECYSEADLALTR